MSTLRVLTDQTDPLTVDQLQQRGNELLAQARRAGIAALRASTQPDIIDGSQKFTIYDIRYLRKQAEDAAAAWAKVSGLLAEIEREFDKSRRATNPEGSNP
jgi:hypothetical protein